MEEPFPADKAGRIRAGVTTRQEVLTWFGPPEAIERSDGRSVYLYRYGSEESPLAPAPFLDKVERRASVRVLRVRIRDDTGIVEDLRIVEEESESKRDGTGERW